MLVIEATGVMLQAIEKAKAATQALGAAVPQAPRRVPALRSVRVAADGSVVILQAGAEGGDVTLIGRTTRRGNLGVRAGDRRSDGGVVRGDR